jgi:hypothetical protein
MKRDAFSLLALSVALGLILTNTAITQLTEQWQAFAQAPSKIEPAENTGDPMATGRQYIDAFNKGDAPAMAASFDP